MKKEQLEQEYTAAATEQTRLQEQVSLALNRIQQLEGRKDLLKQLHEDILKAEGKLETIPPAKLNNKAPAQEPAGPDGNPSGEAPATVPTT